MIKTILLLLTFLTIPNLAYNSYISEQKIHTISFFSKKNIEFLTNNKQGQQKENEKKKYILKILYIENNAIFNDVKSPYLGAKKPLINIVCFTDYNCFFCKKFESDLEKLIANYPQVRVIIKLLPFHGESSLMAEQFALSVWEKNPKLFFNFHKLLMNKKQNHDSASIALALKEVGINLKKPYPDTIKTINANMLLAEELLVNGTPTSIVNNILIDGLINYEQLENFVKLRH